MIDVKSTNDLSEVVLLGDGEDSFIETVGKFITVRFQFFNQVQMGIFTDGYKV